MSIKKSHNYHQYGFIELFLIDDAGIQWDITWPLMLFEINLI